MMPPPGPSTRDIKTAFRGLLLIVFIIAAGAFALGAWLF